MRFCIRPVPHNPLQPNNAPAASSPLLTSTLSKEPSINIIN